MLYCFCNNDPVNQNDYEGCIIDTLWDVVSIVWDASKIVVGYATNNKELVKEGCVDFAVDAVALAVPGLPAGATKIARLGSAAKITSASISVTKRSMAGRLSVKKGKEFSEMVVGVIRKETTDVRTNVRLQHCLPNGRIETAELDIIFNHKICELKNWKRITPSGAERISQQVRRQMRVGEANNHLGHLGVVINDATKMSKQAQEVFPGYGIPVYRFEEFQLFIKQSVR